MVQVKIRNNLRSYDDYDTDFSIRAGEIKEFPSRLLKSYSIKRALMSGDLILVSGDVEFTYKDAIFKINGENPNDGIFLFADNTTAIKNLDTNKMEAKKVEVEIPLVKSGSLSTPKPKEELKKHGKKV